MMEDDDEFDSEAGGPNGLGLKNLHPRSNSMPFINNVHPSSWPKAVKKLKLVPTDSIASNGSFYGHVYGSKADSGIVDEHASGMSVGVIPDALVEAGFLGVQGDFNSQGSGMLGSEPQSEVEVAEHQILGRVHSSSGTGGSRTGSSDPESGGTKNGVKLVAILNPFDIRNPKNLRTLKQHYYPEGGWGWVILLVTLCVQIISHGLQIALAMYVMAVPKSSVISRRLLNASFDQSGWLGAMSMSVSFLISPIVIGFCRRKSTRLTAVMGGLVTALGCLFTSFASQFHQLFFSYGAMIGVGVAMTRDPATLMVGQYFKRKRELVEIFLVSGSGLGIATMSVFIKTAISSIGWRHGLQAVTGVVFLTFVLGTFYRSASLYHPQRRAILHLKSQKRKIKSKDKEKNKIQDDTPPFFDFTTLKSRTVQLLLLSVGVGSFGLNSPIFYLAQQAIHEGIRGKSLLLLQAYLGIAWVLGCILFGCIVVNNSTECRISKQYLCQAALFMAGVSILAFTAVEGYNGYVVFVWIYGIFNGGYHYTLKMYIYEKVRARNFARAWGFAQASMAIPNAIGIPALGYLNTKAGDRAGYFFSASFVILGSLVMFLIDVHRRNLRQRKRARQLKKSLAERISVAPDGSVVIQDQPGGPDGGPDGASGVGLALAPVIADEIELRRNSFSDQDDILPPVSLLSHQRSFVYDDIGIDLKKPELTLYSEEGIADMDLPDNILFDDIDYLDNITSCNKVENCLMLSEYEQNLIKENEGPTARRNKKWSLFRQPTLQTINSEGDCEDNVQSMTIGVGGLDTRNASVNASAKGTAREIPKFPNPWRFRRGSLANRGRPNRAITVIEEASV